MLKIRRLSKRTYIPIEILQPFVDSWISMSDHLLVGFEERDIHGIKAYDSHVEPHVDFRDKRPEVVGPRVGRGR